MADTGHLKSISKPDQTAVYEYLGARSAKIHNCPLV